MRARTQHTVIFTCVHTLLAANTERSTSCHIYVIYIAPFEITLLHGGPSRDKVHAGQCSQQGQDLYEGYVHAAERGRGLVSIADGILALTTRADILYPTHIVQTSRVRAALIFIADPSHYLGI